MSVMVATAYMEEAERFDWLAAMDDGRVIATGIARGIEGTRPRIDARRRIHKPSAGGETRRPSSRHRPAAPGNRAVRPPSRRRG